MRRGAALAAAVLSLAVGFDLAAEENAPRPAWLAGRPPSGWSEIPALGRNVGTALRQSAPFGKLRARAGAVAHAERGTGAFYLSWLESDQPAEKLPEAVRGALDRLRESRAVSSSDGRSTEELRYEERVADGIAEVRLEWRHLSNETVSMVRAFVWASRDGKPRLGAAECVVSTAGAPRPASEKACRDALGSVAIHVPAAERAAIAELPASRPQVAEAEPPPVALETPPTIGPAAPGIEGNVLYRGPEPAEERRGPNPLVIGIGAALVLGASYWTMRRRARDADRARRGSPHSLPLAQAKVLDPAPETTDER